MKENLIKTLFVGITVAIGITVVILIKGGKYSLQETVVYGFVAFVVDYIFSLIFNKTKRLISVCWKKSRQKNDMKTEYCLPFGSDLF